MLGASVLAPGFRELGHSVVTCTTDETGDVHISGFPISVQSVLLKLPFGWHPDFILLTDDSTYPMFLGIEEVDVPLGWYAIDSHIHHAWHRAYAAIFDFMFVAQRDHLPLYVFDQERQVVTWLPLCAFPFPQTKRDLPPLYDLSVVGNVSSRCNPERRTFIESLQTRYPLHVVPGEFISIFTCSKMVLNQCASQDVNFRNVEAMACGVCCSWNTWEMG